MATVPATGGSSHASREARRRRIAERGSDRLALITGSIQSLPSDPNQSPNPTCPPDQTPADSSQHEDIASGSPLPDHQSGKEPSQHDIFDETVDPLPSNRDNGRSIASRAVSLLGIEKELFQVASSMRIPPLLQVASSMRSPAPDHQSGQQRSPAPEGQREQQRHRNSLTTGQIRSAISASENARMCCSLAAAILVIFSYMEFPVLGCHIVRRTIFFRPVYLLLLTNISIVLAQLILGRQGAELRTGQTSSVPAFGGNALVDQLGKALESGLLLQNIIGALFMDFSIYAVVFICGLSLVRTLGL